MTPRKLILMYHSVDSSAHPAVAGSFPVPFDRLVYQLSAARRLGWDFGAVSRLHDPVARDILYVTGDDGTVDWVRNVLPWADEAGIPTHTALITGPWRDPPAYPVAHRVQLLLTLRGVDLPVPVLTHEQAAYVDRVYAYETDERRRRLKGACNVILEDQEARALLGPPGQEELRELRNRFASPGEYAGLSLAEFGVHTVSHNAFSGDPGAYVADEILPCREDIRQAGLAVTDIFTLPMRPRHPATVEQLVPALSAAGFRGVLDGQGTWDGHSFVIPRIDAKNVEGLLGIPAWERGG